MADRPRDGLPSFHSGQAYAVAKAMAHKHYWPSAKPCPSKLQRSEVGFSSSCSGFSPPRPLSLSPPHEKAQPLGWAFSIWLPPSLKLWWTGPVTGCCGNYISRVELLIGPEDQLTQLEWQ